MKNDYSVSDMERIQKGLEEFLQQETENREPQLYDLRAEADAMSQNDNKMLAREEDAWESDDIEAWEEEDDMTDWDSKESKKREKEVRKTARNGAQKAAVPERKAASRPEAAKQPAKKKKRRKKSGFKRFLTMLLVLVLLVAGGAYFVVGKLYDKMHYETIESVERENLKDDGVINILLIGNDSRSNGEDGRSDAMILLSINSSTKKMYMTSLLRDMYVEIPGYKGNRLNAAYS